MQGREIDEPIAESSIGNSYEAPRTRRCAAIKASIKKSWNPSHLKVPFRHLATQHENVRKRKGEIITELEAVKKLKSEMMTREKKKVAKKARLAPDLREKKLQVVKSPMLEM